ncbi:MAG: hypothetical protein H6Q78_525 [Candidatus Krumholzibacteriota bacterium]|nr:hypothetical protein [Candidatus Krumholzibacteriota bacterium]
MVRAHYGNARGAGRGVRDRRAVGGRGSEPQTAEPSSAARGDMGRSDPLAQTARPRSSRILGASRGGASCGGRSLFSPSCASRDGEPLRDPSQSLGDRRRRTNRGKSLRGLHRGERRGGPRRRVLSHSKRRCDAYHARHGTSPHEHRDIRRCGQRQDKVRAVCRFVLRRCGRDVDAEQIRRQDLRRRGYRPRAERLRRDPCGRERGHALPPDRRRHPYPRRHRVGRGGCSLRRCARHREALLPKTGTDAPRGIGRRIGGQTIRGGGLAGGRAWRASTSV